MTVDRISFIVCCQCRDMPAFSRTAIKTLIGARKIHILGDIPEVFHRSAQITKLVSDLDKLPNGSDAANYIRALQKNKEKYSVFFDLDTNGGVVEVWNLKTGRRIY